MFEMSKYIIFSSGAQMEQFINNTPNIERRGKHRITCDYPAMVKGRDRLGQNFVEQGRVVNLSSTGIFLVIGRNVEKDAEITVKIALPTGSLVWGTSNLATSGIVVRNETQTDGGSGIAVKFHGYRFL